MRKLGWIRATKVFTNNLTLFPLSILILCGLPLAKQLVQIQGCPSEKVKEQTCPYLKEMTRLHVCSGMKYSPTSCAHTHWMECTLCWHSCITRGGGREMDLVKLGPEP